MELECMNCHITLEKEEIELKYNNKCPMCGKINSFVEEYIMDLKRISSDESFIQAMIKLKQDDIIEYQSRMSHFKTQLQLQKASQREMEQREDTTPRCPHCHSTDIESLSFWDRGISVALFGLYSDKIGKTFQCNNCGYMW